MESVAPRPASSPAPSVNARGSGVHFQDVTVRYRGVTALESLTLDIHAGEVVALLGPSGSGKTTALKAAAGFVPLFDGRLFIGEQDSTNVPPNKRGIGMVVQQYALFPHMTVHANVAFGMKAQRVRRAEIDPRVRESLRLVNMESYAKRHPRELSGGQQQRVALARALAIRPRVLLLDEPLSALDAQLRTDMLSEIARLHRELPDVTIVYVTHDQNEALSLADRIALMSETRLHDVGSARELYYSPRSEFAARFLGNANVVPAEVVETDDSGYALVRSGDEALRVVCRCSVAPGSSQSLCVRPQSLRLSGSQETDNRLTGTVTEVLWSGATHRIALEANGSVLRAEVPAIHSPPQIGDDLTVYFAPDDTILIHESNGRSDGGD